MASPIFFPLFKPLFNRYSPVIGNLGMEIGEWEMLLGMRWSKVKFSDIASGAEDFVFSGTSFMFGLGWGF